MKVSSIAYRIITVVAATLIMVPPVTAETVSQKQAKRYAQEFFDTYYRESTAPVAFVYNGKRLTTNRLFTPFYVYNSPRGGYVAISAENKTFPVLMYSLTGAFDPERLGDGETALLRNYALDIENIRYDSRVPERAIKAWGDYDAYIKSLVEDPLKRHLTLSEAADRLDYLWTTDAGLDSYADLYTPAQWQEMVDSEIAERDGAAVGIIDKDGLHPVVAYGKKGDYYRFIFGERNGGEPGAGAGNSWMARLQASELMSDRQLLSTLHPTFRAPIVEQQEPFAFHQEFLAEIERQKREEERKRGLKLTPDKPVIKTVGGGHFDIVMPENVKLAMIYNLSGEHVGRRTYGDTNVAHINIEAQPAGFYFVIVYGDTGRPYGIKLVR